MEEMNMIKANELRIGNLVNLCFKHKEGWYPAKVTAIHKDLTLDTDTQESKKDRYYWEGLPLSDIILDRSCFRYVGSEYLDGGVFPGWYANEHKGWSMRIWKRDSGAFMFSINEVTTLELKHLHQLQNLYFCLCGEELIIEL